MSDGKTAESRIVVLGTVAWLLLAVMAGASGLVASVPPPFPQILLFFLVLILFLIFWKRPYFREWILGVDIRMLVLIHLFRFVGIYFLVLHSRGELPYAFAVPGGWGDIAVAASALFLAIFSPLRGKAGWRSYLVWNSFGLADILFVVATASRLAMDDPESMRAITRFPLSLLPTFLVPIVIFTHIVIFIRLLKGHDGSGESAEFRI